MNYSFVFKNIIETMKKTNKPGNIQNDQRKEGKQLGRMCLWYNNKWGGKKEKRENDNLFIVNNYTDTHINGKNQEEYHTTETSLVLRWEDYGIIFSPLSTSGVK